MEVLITKDFNLIPLPSSILGLLCSITWFTYGFLDPFNISIVIPNGLGKRLSFLEKFF